MKIYSDKYSQKCYFFTEQRLIYRILLVNIL
jgi:hypothetical protein